MSGNNEEKDPRFKAKSERLKPGPFATFLANIFETDLKDVIKGLYDTYVVPNIKEFVNGAGHFIIDTWIFGDSKKPASRGGSSIVRTTESSSYSAYYKSLKPKAIENTAQNTNPNKKKWHFEDLVWAKRIDAKDFLDDLKQVVAEDGQISVSALYDAFDDDSTDYMEFTDSSWGWKSFDDAYIRQTFRGWRLFLPTPIPLD
jgi:hypothetical protein